MFASKSGPGATRAVTGISAQYMSSPRELLQCCAAPMLTSAESTTDSNYSYEAAIVTVDDRASGYRSSSFGVQAVAMHFANAIVDLAGNSRCRGELLHELR